MVNLLNNAAKYTDPGGLVRMAISREGAEAVIRIWDNGIGISPELLPQIFELFTQVDGSLGRSYGGLGIGLALAQNIVELHEGRLQGFSGGLSQGSEFTIKLPLLVEHSVHDAETMLEPIHDAGQPLKILLVEDNIDSGDTMSMLLRLSGHHVELARSGPNALEIATTYHSDVVLMDIGIPGMDGYQVVTRLREISDYQHLTICALTGYTPSDADRQRQQETGFDHYFIKPVGLNTLLDLLKTIRPRAT